MKRNLPVFEQDVEIVTGFVRKHPGTYNNDDLKYLLVAFYDNDNREEPSSAYVCNVIDEAVKTGKIKTHLGVGDGFFYPSE